MVEEKSLEFLGYPNYSVFSDGLVMNVINGKILGGHISLKGYKVVNLKNYAGLKTFKIHRLLGLAFIPAVEGKNTIDHINRNKLDNRIENLRWADYCEQVHNTGNFKNNQLGHKHIRKQENSYRVTITRNYVRVFTGSFQTLAEAILARDNFLYATD